MLSAVNPEKLLYLVSALKSICLFNSPNSLSDTMSLMADIPLAAGIFDFKVSLCEARTAHSSKVSRIR